MASFADALTILTGTELFEVVIPFILAYVVIYAIMKNVKWVEGKELQAGIAFVLALGLVMSPFARTFVTTIIPPLVSFGLVIFLFLLVLFSSGLKMDDIVKITGFSHDKGNPFWIILFGVSIILIVAALASAYPDAISSSSENVEQNALEMNMSVNDYVNTLPAGERVMFFLSLPQVMGLILLVIIFVLAGAIVIG